MSLTSLHSNAFLFWFIDIRLALGNVSETNTVRVRTINEKEMTPDAKFGEAAAYSGPLGVGVFATSLTAACAVKYLPEANRFVFMVTIQSPTGLANGAHKVQNVSLQ